MYHFYGVTEMKFIPLCIYLRVYMYIIERVKEIIEHKKMLSMAPQFDFNTFLHSFDWLMNLYSYNLMNKKKDEKKTERYDYSLIHDIAQHNFFFFHHYSFLTLSSEFFRWKFSLDAFCLATFSFFNDFCKLSFYEWF